jgi:hypothetical protein
MIRKILWAVFIVGVPFFIIYGFATIDRRSDEDKIRSAVLLASNAAAHKNLGGTLEVVSQNYKDGEMLNYDRMRAVLAQVFYSDVNYNLKVKIKKITVGDKSSSADLHAIVTYSKGTIIPYDRDVRLIFEKEKAHHLLFFPVSVWRVTKAENLGLGPLNEF